MKDINGLKVTPFTTEPQSFDTKNDRYLARAGDVLFTNRGTLTKAAVMPEHSDTFVAPAQLSVITPSDPIRLTAVR